MSTFLPLSQENYAKRLEKSSWEKMYPLACEDFAIHNDLHRFMKDLELWMAKLNDNLAQQFKLLSEHGHVSPPNGGITTPPTTQYLIKWPTTTYILPKFVNTSGVKPNINDTGSGFVGFTTRTTKPTINISQQFLPPSLNPLGG